MIDIENMVFDRVFNALSLLRPEANITAGYDEKSAVFPTVIVREIGNIPYHIYFKIFSDDRSHQWV